MNHDQDNIDSMGLKVADHVTAMLAYWDSNLICRFANAAYREWFGKTREEMINKMTLPQLIGPLYEKNLPYILGALQGKPQQFEREIITPAGDVRHSLANYLPDIVNGEVKGFFVHVADISQLKLLEKELTRFNEQIKEQNKRLLSFANIVSHNLRSHANNLKEILDLFVKSTAPDEKEILLNFLKSISRGFSETVTHLNEIVAIQNQLTLSMEDINLRHYVSQCLDMLAVQIKSTGANVANNVSSDLFVKGNPAYMESILLNLLTNALKYKHPDRKPLITITTSVDGEMLVLRVQDNGLGIDLRKHQDEIFGMYKTFHKNPEAKGIGLFLTKMQVEAMGGTIKVESEENKGTSFILHLPISSERAPFNYDAA